jgi:hypothetical protein
LSIIVNEHTNNINKTDEINFDLYCGAIVNSETGYCNYPLNDLSSLGEPTLDNYQKWYIANDFLTYSQNLKVIRPINSANIENCSLTYDNTNLAVKSGIKLCFNPIVAKNTLDVMTLNEKLLIISKDVRSYDEDYNIAVSICSSSVNYLKPIFNDVDLSLFGDSLIEYNGDLKTYMDLTNGSTDFDNNEFVIIIIEIVNGKYELNESATLSYLNDNKDLELIYLKTGNSNHKVETFNSLIHQNLFLNTVSSIDFTLTHTNYEEAINVLENDDKVKAIISYDINSVGSITNKVNFVGLFEVSRYIQEDNIGNKVLEDFRLNSTYFTTHKNGTVIIANMYKKWDNYNCMYIWLPFNGIYAGLYFSKELKLPINTNDFVTHSKLLFKTTEANRKSLISNNINIVVNRRGANYVYGNLIFNDKLVIKNVYNHFIIEELKHRFLVVKNKYVLINNREVNIIREEIYNEIEIILKKYYNFISNYGLNYVINENVINFYITVFLHNTVDNFIVDIDFKIKD